MPRRQQERQPVRQVQRIPARPKTAAPTPVTRKGTSHGYESIAIAFHLADQSKGKRKIHKNMKEHKSGTLKSGSGKKAKSRKQAVAIALSKARKSGVKVPKRKKS
jgi:hypothetical protein